MTDDTRRESRDLPSHLKPDVDALLPAELSAATKRLVIDFAVALGEKLHAAEQKYGYEDGWRQDGWEGQCRTHLYDHLAKGDPRDVANYCAFMWFHGWSTRAPGSPCRSDGRCQYAIDHGAEGMGHCPTGKCSMPVSGHKSERSEIGRITELEAEVAALRERLEEHEGPARRKARLYEIVALCFPEQRGKDRKPQHPDKSWWWNGAGVDENSVDLGYTGGAKCVVESYVGGGETDRYEFDIPAEWMNAEDWKPLVLKWIEDATEQSKRNEQAARRANAAEELKEAQRRFDEANK